MTEATEHKKYKSKVTSKGNSSYSYSSQEEADQRAKVLDDTGCLGCISCIDCIDCLDCIGCVDCIYCVDCTLCISCTRCTGCIDYINCTNSIQVKSN